MKSQFFITCLLMFFNSLAFGKTTTVDSVDLNRYLGTWYEIGSIPQRFSKGCHCTRAQYSLKEDGNVRVLNTCNKESVTGKLSKANGTAKVVDQNTNAKLKVTFFWPFYGDYHIIGLDPDYRYAVVSNEEGSSLWILSRTPVLDSSLLNQALEVAKRNGIEMDEFKYMEHQGCQYPEMKPAD